MKSPSAIALFLMTTLLTACDDPKKWNPQLPGAHEGSSVGDHQRPAEESGTSKKAAEEKPPMPGTGVPPGGQTRPQVPTPPPAVPPAVPPAEAPKG